MDTEPLIEKLKQYGIYSKQEYYDQAFSRNIGLLTEEEQEKLSNATVGIPGMGGVGGIHFMTMVRTGVGRFHISDFDVYEPANINRQFGARVPDFGRPKMEVMKEQALSVNPYIQIKKFPKGISPDTVDEFLDGLDVVLDSLDFFAFDARRLLFTRAREKGIHVITAGPLGFSAAMLVFAPDKGMGFDEYFNIIHGMKSEDRYIAFALGLAPKATQFKYMDTSKLSFRVGKAPSLNIACHLCSAVAGTEAVKVILKRGKVKAVPYYFQFDPYLHKFCHKKLYMGNRHPWQKIKTILVKQMVNRSDEIGPEEPEMPKLDVSDPQVTSEILEYIIKAGIQAPSGDNSQPWEFSIEENLINLYLNVSADKSFFNVSQIASIISCGAVIENMKLAASKFHLKAEIEYVDGKKEPKQLAKISFSPESGKTPDPLADVIWERITNRKLFKAEPPPNGLIQALKAECEKIRGVDISFVTQQDQLKKLAVIIGKADRIRIERKDLHEHLMQMIRFTKKDALKKRDGFYIKNLEAGLAGDIFLKCTRSWPVMNIANKLGIGKIVSDTAVEGVLNSSGVALVVVNGFDTDCFLRGGRALERIWLEITKQGLYIQPMTAITLFFLRRQLLGGAHMFSEYHTRILNEIWPEFKKLFPNVNFDKQGQVLLFRFGRAMENQFGTLRRSLNSFCVQ